jgi:hypothetical protein
MYNKDGIPDDYEYLWPASYYMGSWVGAQYLDQLKSRLEVKLNQRPNQSNGNTFFGLSSHLEPDPNTIKNAALNFSSNKICKNLKEMADVVHSELPALLTKWKNQNPNVITLDFMTPELARDIVMLNDPTFRNAYNKPVEAKAAASCYFECPPGFRDDGPWCYKPKEYTRGAGYDLLLGGGEARCRAENPGGCEPDNPKFPLIYYPKCQAGYRAAGCCICTAVCPDFTTDVGISCARN